LALLIRKSEPSTLTPSADARIRENPRVSVERIAWIVTTLIALLTSLLLLLAGYDGYAGLGVAVAAAAAINLL
jgi:hypothetical protein